MKCLIESPDYDIAKQLESIALQCAIDAKTPMETKITVRSKIQSSFITLQINVDEALGDSQSWCLACRLGCFCPAARVSIIISAQPLFQQTKNAITPWLSFRPPSRLTGVIAFILFNQQNITRRGGAESRRMRSD